MFEASEIPIGNRFERGCSECCGNFPGDVAFYGGGGEWTDFRVWVAELGRCAPRAASKDLFSGYVELFI